MMRTLPPSYVSNFDSASGMLRATSRYLQGKDFPGWGLSSALKPVIPLARLLSRGQRESVYALGGLNEAISPTKTHKVDVDRIAAWAADLYPRRPFPGVMIGSSSGALTHLAALLGMPWLPQTAFVPVRQTNVHPDDAVEGMEAGLEPGRRLLEANPDVQLHHMHDPNQDRLMLQYMTYFRFKWRRMPQAYRDFIRSRLAPGDPIVIVECQRPVTRLGDRHFFQFGALGGATEEEFLHGGERVEAYLERYDSHRHRWEPPPATEEAPEAEWGFEPALREDIERFARRHGYRVVTLSFPEPEDLSPQVADLYAHLYRQRGLRSSRLIVESFILVEPYWVLRTGSVPYWMKFNMNPSHEALERYLNGAEGFEEIWMTLFQHGVECVGLTPLEHWDALLSRAARESGYLGLRRALYPRDFGALTAYQEAVQQLPSRYPLPGPLPLGELARFVSRRGEQDPVVWRGLS